MATNKTLQEATSELRMAVAGLLEALAAELDRLSASLLKRSLRIKFEEAQKVNTWPIVLSEWSDWSSEGRVLHHKLSGDLFPEPKSQADAYTTTWADPDSDPVGDVARAAETARSCMCAPGLDFGIQCPVHQDNPSG